MKNKSLAQQLNNLKFVQADEDWKAKNREALLSHIENTPSSLAIEQKINIEVSILSSRIKEFFSQPSFALFFVIALVIAGSIFSVRAVNTRPGDSLYIAKIISEKAQLAMIFDEGERAKQGLKFSHDRAKQIAQVLAEASYNNEENAEKTTRLAQDFRNEINTVKNKIKEIKDEADSRLAQGQANDDDSFVFSANIGKEDEGLQISDSPNNVNSSDSQGEASQNNTEPFEAAATSTDSSDNGEADLNNVNRILEEAEELFDNEDYSGTVTKLEEADAIFEGMESNEPGVDEGDNSESATSTES